jgi:hypothetical protein
MMAMAYYLTRLIQTDFCLQNKTLIKFFKFESSGSTKIFDNRTNSELNFAHQVAESGMSCSVPTISEKLSEIPTMQGLQCLQIIFANIASLCLHLKR